MMPLIRYSSATLNPEQTPFCVDSRETSVYLPLRINQTTPILIELLRIDLDTSENETITISSKEIKKIKREAEKEAGKKHGSGPQIFKLPVKHTGLYRLQKVVDESKLEVQRRLSDTLVVKCPSASVKSVASHKCMGQLSNFFLQVDATPPFRIKYSKIINREDQSNVLLNIVPENFDSPLVKQRTSGALIKLDQGQPTDVSWARNQRIEIPINETLGVSGGWRYSIDEVHDACGNIANYTTNDNSVSFRTRRTHLDQVFVVHEPPKAALSRNMESPLNVAKGQSTTLPVYFSSTGTHRPDSDSDLDHYHISYTFTPETEVSLQEDNASVNIKEISIKHGSTGPRISEPGLYTLNSVSTEFCSGDILQPSSCILINPPEPDLDIKSTNISDRCANNSIGLLLDLGLVGSPPFHVSYSIKREGGYPGAKGTLQSKVVKIDHMRTQLELKPSDEGKYTYEFLDINDAVYPMHSLREKNLVFRADVRPPASARFAEENPKRFSCIQQSVAFDIILSGEAPWTLEYEITHGKKPDRRIIENITNQHYELKTADFLKGGEHLLSLVSVTDKFHCQVFLEQEARIDVRHHEPQAAFGQLDGKRSIEALEGKEVNLPVRLSGEPPWTVIYTHFETEDSKTSSTHTMLAKYANDVIKVGKPGIYLIKDVYDKSCWGSVDPKSSQFRVSWLSMPTVRLAESSAVEPVDEKLFLRAVCEGDQDAMELVFTGTPPFNLKYEVHGKPDQASAFVSRRKETAGLSAASIRTDTTRSGTYEYKFSELEDQLYEHDRRKWKPLYVQQRVHNRPSASFVNAKKTYSYCKEDEAGDEVIPMKLVGKAPFSLEIGIRRHATSRPEFVRIPHIDGHDYNFNIPHRVLALGKHGVSIRKIQDGNGCQRVTEFDGPVVYVDVVDIPNISPLEATTDYCVGDRISYALSGTPPFNVFYTFDNTERKASVATTNFRRIAERRGDFTVTGVSDKASTDACRSHISITKIIHELPSVRISKGRTAEVDIHEGGEADILFEFGGAPPFEFT